MGIAKLNGLNQLLRSVVVIIASGLILVGCGEDQSVRTMPPPGVLYVNVTEQPIGDYHEFVARTEAVDQVELRARVEGFINERAFNEGEQVEKGQLLFELDRKPYIASLAKAEADVASSKASLVKATRDLNRSNDLFNQGYISQSDLDNQVSAKAKAEAGVKAADAALESARLNLSYTHINAPFSGKVGKERYSVGSLVGPGSDPLATLTSVDPIYVNFQINEKELISYTEQVVATGRHKEFDLQLRLPTGSVYNQSGEFNFTDTVINQSTGTLNLRAVFPNPDGLLYPGLYVTLIAESEDKKIRALIPQSAVQENQTGRFVMIVNENNIAEIRPVIMGRRVGPMWVVNDGLQAGEKLIVGGLQKVRANALVQPQEVIVDSETGTIGNIPQQ